MKISKCAHNLMKFVLSFGVLSMILVALYYDLQRPELTVQDIK
jgi:hypothetical protein